jgi:RHS repeat-associated protein
VGQNTTTYSYDPASNLATVTYPNGLESSFTLDNLNRVTSLNNAKLIYDYTLDAAGNRRQVIEHLPNEAGRTVNWSYDNIYRLTDEVISLDPHSKNGNAHYDLDPVGNRTQETATLPGLLPGSFTYDADDRLNTETYDANGNTLTSGGKTFTYDFENRLKSMTEGTVAVTLAYDADGNRAAKTVGATTTLYLVDDLNPTGYAQVVEEVTGTTASRTYTYGLQRISQNQQLSNIWTPSFYGYDGGGTVRLLTDSTGTVTGTYDYDAWGNAVNTTGSTPNVYLYRGEQYDTDLGLYYLRARYFDPLSGRFLTTDPADGDASDPSTLHRYLYAGSDPVNGRDPSGRATTMEYTLLTGFVLTTGLVIYEAEMAKSIKCVWCEAVSQLAAGFFVDIVAPGVKVLGEAAGHTLCTVAVLTTMPWYFARRGHSDPIPWPGRLSPGPDPGKPGKCMPCPPDSPYWKDPGNKHGGTGGFHFHWYRWNQLPYPDCRCVPDRMGGGSPPSGGTPHAPGGPPWP